ncbi:MAG: hypothetical protein KDE29_20475 [Anaerolineales bacterium]|nr:hypothetical protein [Anaerolineales bacterium]
MKCDRCGEPIPAGDEMEHYGETLCEVCTMRALSPARACDPWAVRSAQTLSQLDDSYAALSEVQEKIVQVLAETGGVTAEVLAQKLALSLPELERELATLRHMEKIRGKMEAGKKIVCLWEA